jgi:nucleotide-binding universal stress UspA family protein
VELEVKVMFKHLLIAIDGSDHADRAIGIAADLTMRYHAKLTILHVARHPRVMSTFSDLEELERSVSHKVIHLSDVPVLAVR